MYVERRDKNRKMVKQEDKFVQFVKEGESP
jgi:hypothetical protein